VLASVAGISPSRWSFKPNQERWSIAEILEHLVLVEEVFLDHVVPNFERLPPAPTGDWLERDARVLALGPDPSTNWQAPALIQPTVRWTPDESLRRFVASIGRTGSFLTDTMDLRQHAAPHPVLGPLDGYQWVLLMATHAERHAKQIATLKADVDFRHDGLADVGSRVEPYWTLALDAFRTHLETQQPPDGSERKRSEPEKPA
jgi:hypothetical protein